MGDTNRTRVSYVKETTWGTTPASPNMQNVRITGESLVKNVENITSEELRDDAQIADLIQVFKKAEGDLNFELSYGTFDDMLELLVRSSGWSTPVNVSASDIAADATGFTSTSLDFTAQNISVGQWIKVDGFSDTSINGFYRVTSLTANDLNVTPAPAATEAAGATVTMKGSQIKNGTTDNSLSIEVGFLDIAEYFLFKGMVPVGLNLELASKAIAKGSFSFLGKDGTLSGTSVDASPTAANTNTVMNAINNVASLREGNSEVASPNYVKGLTMAVTTNPREKDAVSNDSMIGVGKGYFEVTGNLNTYFGNSDLMDKYIAGTPTSIDMRLKDASNNEYIIDMPQVKFETGSAVAQGANDDVFADLGYRAIMDPTYKFTLQICRFPAA